MTRALEKEKRKQKKEISLHMSKVKLTPPLSMNPKKALCFCGNDSSGFFGRIVTHESCHTYE